MRRSIYVLALISLPFGIVGQTPSPARQVRQASTARIAALSAQLRFQDAVGAAHYRDIRDTITSRIHSEVDSYIVQALEPDHVDSKTLGRDLDELLSTHRYNPEYSGPPFAHVSDSPNGRRLVVAYMLVRGGNAVNDTSVTLRGYRIENGSFHLAASTGSDLDGHGLFVRELQSPVLQETWILVWGSRFGFNGNKVRMRVYAYDGDSFRSVWSPQDALNVTITTNNDGLSVNHLDENRYFVTRHPPYYLRDDYALTPNGVRLIASHYLPE